MWLWCLFALVVHAAAHVPTFDDDLLEQDVVGKSWGVYRHLEAHDSMLLRLNVAAGEELSFSVNLLGSADFVPGTEYVNVTLYGHNTSHIVCEPEYTGWGRRLHVDQLRVFDTVDHGLHYEPFGVGLYRALVACKGDAVVGDVFNLTITALQAIPVSVGVGMAESFGFVDFAVMSFSFRRTWILDAWSEWWYLFSALGSLGVVYAIWGKPDRWHGWEIALIQTVLLFNVLQFSSRLIQVTMYGGPLTDPMLSATMVLHIILPLVVCGSVRPLCTCYRLPCAQGGTRCDTAYHVLMRVLLVGYSFTLLWQGYHLIALVLAGVWGVYSVYSLYRPKYAPLGQK